MVSLPALLRAYDLDAGDTIYVDTGVYSLATNIVLDAQDSGVRIQGPQVVGHTATLNRGNTASGRVVFQLNGADDVTLSHLAITGGQYGIQAASVDSDRITVRNSDIFGNTVDGIQFAAGNDDLQILSSTLHGNVQQGADLAGARARVEGNEIFGNAQYGLAVTFNGAVADRIVVRDNRIHDNATGGVSASGDAWITDNQIYGHTASGRYGIVANGADLLVEANDVHHNAYGVFADYSAVVRGNEIYGNAQTGVVLGTVSGQGANILGNRIYGNSIGINDTGFGHIDKITLERSTSVRGARFVVDLPLAPS